MNKKVLTGAAAIGLSCCMLVGLTACGGTFNKAKSIRGEQVTEDEWRTAFTDPRLGGGTIGTLSAAPQEEETAGPDFRMEVAMEMSVNAEGEGQSMAVDMQIEIEFAAVDNLMYMSVSAAGEMSAPEGDESVTEALEVYLAMEDDGIYLYMDEDGDGVWTRTLTTASGVPDMDDYFDTGIVMDFATYADSYSQFTWNEANKGYSRNLSEDLSGIFSMPMEMTLTVKIVDGALAAMVIEGSLGMEESGVSMDMSVEAGALYTLGGQSITLPEVA